MKTFLKRFPLMCCFAIMGCSSDDTPLSKVNTQASKSPETKNSSQGYLKPGASVRFEHDYDGVTGVGEQEAIQLSFNEHYTSGILSISIVADNGLLINSGTLTQSFSMGKADSWDIPLVVSANEDGKYYLKIFADIEHGSAQHEKRAFDLAINVGDTKANASETKTMKETASGETLIILPVTETISK